MSKVTMDKKLSEYLTEEANVWKADTAKDQKGRALLPLDYVAFPYPTDEGPIVVLRGTVMGSGWEMNGVLEGTIPIKVDRHFCETFGLMPLIMLSRELLVKMPNDVFLNNYLASKLTEGNVAILVQSGGKLHINHVPISLEGKHA